MLAAIANYYLLLGINKQADLYYARLLSSELPPSITSISC